MFVTHCVVLGHVVSVEAGQTNSQNPMSYVSIVIKKLPLGGERDDEYFEGKVWNGRRDKVTLPNEGDLVVLQFNVTSKKLAKDGQTYWNSSTSIWDITILSGSGGESEDDRKLRQLEEEREKLLAKKAQRNGEFSTRGSGKPVTSSKPVAKAEVPVGDDDEEVAY